MKIKHYLSAIASNEAIAQVRSILELDESEHERKRMHVRVRPYYGDDRYDCRLLGL